LPIDLLALDGSSTPAITDADPDAAGGTGVGGTAAAGAASSESAASAKALAEHDAEGTATAAVLAAVVAAFVEETRAGEDRVRVAVAVSVGGTAAALGDRDVVDDGGCGGDGRGRRDAVNVADLVIVRPPPPRSSAAATGGGRHTVGVHTSAGWMRGRTRSRNGGGGGHGDVAALKPTRGCGTLSKTTTSAGLPATVALGHRVNLLRPASNLPLLYRPIPIVDAP
jgi:hypothetical protein